MDKGAGVKGEDVPVSELVPLHKRWVRKSSFGKLRASIQAVGLIEPLCVYPEGGQYIILDGYLRYRACVELGVASVPCLILPTKEAYTPNRMVNHLSAVQENRMIAQSLGTLDEETLASALGIASIKHRINAKLLNQLHPQVISAFDEKNVPLRQCARDLTFVKPEYQLVVLEEMEKAGDFSPAYARTLIVRAPDLLRNENGRRSTPWSHGEVEKKNLASKLDDAEKRFDFYAGLYRQYVADLLKLCIYVRRLLTSKEIGAFLKAQHPDILERFQEIIFETEGKEAT
jgi:hypothetical protein